MSPETQTLLPVYTAFGGIVLGALASFFPAYALDRLKRKAAAESLTDAIVAEISVVVEITRRRRYLEKIEDLVERLRTKELLSARLKVILPEDHAPIFSANLQSVGVLPHLIRKSVVKFHQLVKAASADIRPGGLLAENDGDLEQFQELYAIGQDALRLGDKIVTWYDKNHA